MTDYCRPVADQLAMATDDTRAHLRELEAELDEYPDQRGEILLEIAAAWLEAGEPDRAVVIWRDLIAEGGEDEDYARVELAEYLFGIGEDESARAELAALMATRRTAAWADGSSRRNCSRNVASWPKRWSGTRWRPSDSRPTRGQPSATTAGWVSVPGMLVRRRREVRTAMGLPPDETDQLVPAEEGLLELVRRRFLSTEDAVDTMHARRGAPTEVRLLFWPRSEFDQARERWPDAIDQDVSRSQSYRDLEVKLDAMASEGARRIDAVPCSVESFAVYLDAGGDRPLDSSAARRDYLDARYSGGHYFQWPPPRNKPCWCGSDTKYKKCCGAPTH